MIRDLIQRFWHSDSARAQVLRHLAVGGSGVLFNWLAFSALRHFTTLGTLYSTLIVHAVLLAIIFPLQKFFTFKKSGQGGRQALRFLVNDAGYMSLDFALAWFFIDWLGLAPIVGKACGLAVLTPLSFLSQRLWVFRS